MKRYTLNLNTCRNVFIMKTDFHRIFDGGLWLLMPDEEDVLEAFSKSVYTVGRRTLADREMFPQFPHVCLLILT
jgi:hypothetical protein